MELQGNIEINSSVHSRDTKTEKKKSWPYRHFKLFPVFKQAGLAFGFVLSFFSQISKQLTSVFFYRSTFARSLRHAPWSGR